jgi:hypothetical protein
MAEAWIENLAEDIKQRNREAAEQYGRAQHCDGVIADRGKTFFVALVSCLQENVDALRRKLQGDLVSADTNLETIKADEVKITRARFPWVDARLTHREDTILLDYAKGVGTAGDPQIDRKTRAYVFQVAPDDTLFVQDAFDEPPQRYEQPEELARHITEFLFQAVAPSAGPSI